MEYNKEGGRFFAIVEMTNGASDKEIFEKLRKPFPDTSLSYSTVSLWFKSFRDQSRTTCSDMLKSGRPRTSRSPENGEKLAQLLNDNPRYSCRFLSEELGISKETVRDILTLDLKMRKLCSVWVPHDLTENNKQQRVTAAQGILDALDKLGPQASRVYAVEDESWFEFFPNKTTNAGLVNKRSDRRLCDQK